MRKKVWHAIKNILLTIGLLLSIFSIFIFFNFSYLSADARYARDNLEYLSDQMVSKGILSESDRINVRGIHALEYPVSRTVAEICDLSDQWTYGYMKALEKTNANGTKISKTMIDNSTPYNTLAKLTLEANDEDIQTMYDVVQMDAAMLNTDSLSSVAAAELDHLLESKETDAETASENLFSTVFWSRIFTLMGLMYIAVITIYICKKKRKCPSPKSNGFPPMAKER